MTYIPKRKTLHIRHEDVVKSSYAYPKGRLWFGTDAQYTAEGYTVGNHVSTVNLTGSKYIDGNIEPLYVSGRDPRTWGLPAGEYSLEYEILVSLSSTADPAEFRVQNNGGDIDTTNYSPAFTAKNAGYYNISTQNYISWADMTENSVNYRTYKMSKKFSSTGFSGTFAYGNLYFAHRSVFDTKLIECHYEDIKIVKLD